MLTATEQFGTALHKRYEALKVMAHISLSGGMHLGIAERATGFAGALRDKWRRYGVYRETIRELAALSDRDLNDLGLHRSQITTIAVEAAYGK